MVNHLDMRKALSRPGKRFFSHIIVNFAVSIPLFSIPSPCHPRLYLSSRFR